MGRVNITIQSSAPKRYAAARMLERDFEMKGAIKRRTMAIGEAKRISR
jgi:hypothetical protein